MSSARPRYFTDLNLFVGRKCNAACDHCSVFSSPAASARMSAETLEGVLRMIADFAAAGPGGRVLLTGGEPLLFASEMAILSRAARAQGLRFGVETNAFWAKTPTIAQKLLMRYEIDTLIISASRFHELFVPPARVLTAYRTARAMGLDCEVRISTVAGEPLEGELAALKVAVVPEHLIEEPVAGFGRAAEMVAQQPSVPAATGDPMTCPSDGPIVMEDGRVDPCCGPLSALDDHALDMGNVGTGGGLDRIARDPVFATLHRNGLRAFVEQLETQGLPARCHLGRGDVCAVCAAIMSDPVLAPAISNLREGGALQAPRRVQNA